ncbi:hypothetical protein D7X25_23920 [bacterium 1XD42-8]|nr:hypothetical protein D7X25_23920 [bacterium 1XD42-8]
MDKKVEPHGYYEKNKGKGIWKHHQEDRRGTKSSMWWRGRITERDKGEKGNSFTLLILKRGIPQKGREG